MTIRNPECTVGFVRNDGGQWEMSLPAPYRVDARKLAIIEEFLTELPMRRVLRAGTTDIARYGLDNPEIMVAFRTGDRSEHTLLIGNLTSTKAQRYVQDPSRPYIFLVDIGYVSQFAGTVSSYRAKTIFDIDLASISEIGLSKAGKVVVGLALAGDVWRISRPYSAAANPVVMSELLVSLRSLKAIAYVEEQNPSLSKLGFTPPSFTLVLRDAHGGQQTLDFGATDESGFLYMRRGEGTDIVKLLASDLDFGSFQPEMLLGEAPFKESINNVRRLTIRDGGTTTEFGVDSVSQPPAYTYRGRRLDEGTFISFYVKCINLVAVGYQPWTPVGAPELTLSSELKDGSRKVLELYPRDAKTFFLRAGDGKVAFFTDAAQVQLVRRWMQKLIGAE